MNSNLSKNRNSLYLAELLMEVVPKVMQAIREEMRKGRKDNLTVPQFRLLAAINRGICHNKELGNRLGVSEAAISRMINFLVKDGLIKKDINKNDRRQTILTLTHEGQKLYNNSKSNARMSLKNKLESLSNDDTELIILGLKILQKKLFVSEE